VAAFFGDTPNRDSIAALERLFGPVTVQVTADGGGDAVAETGAVDPAPEAATSPPSSAPPADAEPVPPGSKTIVWELPCEDFFSAPLHWPEDAIARVRAFHALPRIAPSLVAAAPEAATSPLESTPWSWFAGLPDANAAHAVGVTNPNHHGGYNADVVE
jgi:hypothetical protein